jgi:hypothetical protein
VRKRLENNLASLKPFMNKIRTREKKKVNESYRKVSIVVLHNIRTTVVN